MGERVGATLFVGDKTETKLPSRSWANCSARNYRGEGCPCFKRFLLRFSLPKESGDRKNARKALRGRNEDRFPQGRSL